MQKFLPKVVNGFEYTQPEKRTEASLVKSIRRNYKKDKTEPS